MNEPEFERLRDLAARAAGLLGFYFHLEPAVLFRETRGGAEESFARQIAYYLLHRVFDLKEHEIASAFGKHHSTVQHGVRTIIELRDADEAFEEELVWLGERLEEGAAKGRAYLESLMKARAVASPVNEAAL